MEISSSKFLEKKLRDKLDRYYTHPKQVLEIINYFDSWITDNKLDILEPCCGIGDISNTLKALGHEVKTADIDRGVEADWHVDSMKRDWIDEFGRNYFDLIITNPPFGGTYHCAQWVRKFKELAPVSSFLLPINFLEPAKSGKYQRLDLLCDSPPDHIIIMPRVSFTGDGKTDNKTCMWVIYKRDSMKETTIEVANPFDFFGEEK